MSFRSSTLLALFLLGCPEPESVGPATLAPATPVIPSLPPPPTEDDRCARLEIDGPDQLNALQEAVFAPVAGIGPYRFSLVSSDSGASVQTSGGTFLAGPVAGVDVLRLDDDGCGLGVELPVQIHPEFVVRPRVAVVPPGHSFALQISGGSGQPLCSGVTLASGGSITGGCDYLAGTVEGLDTMQVEDVATGQIRDVEIEVADRPLLDETVLLVPLGARMTLEPAGSGELETSATFFTLVDGVLSPTAPNIVEEAVLEDPVTGLTRTVTLASAAPITLVDPPIEGSQSDWEYATVTDLDGDGLPELLISNIGLSWDAFRSGLVAVYRGVPGGFETTPEILSGEHPVEFFGRGVASGDFDGDGVNELAVGSSSWTRSPTETAVGRVTVWSGTDFTAPLTQLEGDLSNDNLGFGVASCDLDGDGYDDLIAGIPGRDDYTVSPRVDGSGAVSVYLGSPTGLSTTPAVLWHGREPSADVPGLWIEATQARAGSAIATGDLDGDGGCDVAIGAYLGQVGPSTVSGGGGVWLIRGETLLANELPERVYGSSSATNRLGRRILLEDLDGDGRDDLVAGARTANGSRGQVHVYLDPLASVPDAYTDFADSTLMIEGTATRNWMGWTIDAFETPSGVGLMVGEPGGDIDGTNTGAVHWFSPETLSIGSPIDLTGDDSDTVYGGAGRMFGSGMAALPDADGDGFPDAIAIAGRFDNLGIYDSRVTRHDGSGETAVTLEPKAAGHNLGAVVGWSGDHLFTMAPDFSDGALDTGALYRVDGTDLSRIAPHDGNTTRERFGDRLGSVGDLDGDGFEDFAAGSEDRSVSNFESSSYLAGACPIPDGVRVGAVYIYRGTASGPEPQPSWAAFGDATDSDVHAFAGGFDFDGDGQDDFAYGGKALGTPNGSVQLVSGGWTPPPAGSIQVVCGDLGTYTGHSSNSWFGYRLGALPDVDGDGCDELVATAPFDDITDRDVGSVRVIWGTGPTCGPPGLTTFAGDQVSARLGRELAVSDGHLLAANPDYAFGPGRVGAAWTIPVADLVRSPFAGSAMPGDEEPILDVANRLTGTDEAERFGESVGFVNGLALIGRPGAFESGVSVGAVDGYEVGPTGFGPRRLRAVGDGPGSDLGEALAPHPAAVFAIGAPWSDVANVDSGAVYVFDLR